MTANRYGKFLTVILVILIIIILAGLGFLTYKYIIKPRNDENEKIEAFAEIDRASENQKDDEEKNETTNEILEMNPVEEVNNSTGGSGQRKKPRFKGFVMLGYIKIPKTNVKEAILDTVTPETLNTAVAVLYPSNPQLNQPGNVVIVGHNYRNGKFFSNNKKLSTGDKIKIKDNSGTELTYTIYEIFETTEQDTSFYNRDTNGKIEVTLSTCTDDSKARTIILARVE